MPSASEIHAVCRTQVPKRRLSCSKENLLLAKVPKIEHLVKSELIDGQKQGNIIHILKEQNVNVKLVKREDSTESKKEKPIKPKTPAGRVLVSLGGEVGCGKVLANYLTKSHRKSTDEVASFILFIHRLPTGVGIPTFSRYTDNQANQGVFVERAGLDYFQLMLAS